MLQKFDLSALHVDLFCPALCYCIQLKLAVFHYMVRWGRGAQVDLSTPKIVKVRFMGFFTVTAHDGTSLCPVGQKHAGVLAYLLYHAGTQVPREKLIDLFWSESGVKQGQASLRQALHAVRNALRGYAEMVLTIHRKWVRVNREHITSDIWSRDAGALAYGNGGFLENLLSTAPIFDDWVLQTGREITNEKIADAEQKLEKLDLQKDAEKALMCTKTILALDPYNEAAAQTEMTIHANQGRIGQARRTFERLKAALEADDLPVSDETQSLFEALTSGRSRGAATDDAAPSQAASELSSDRGVPVINVSISDTENCGPEKAVYVTEFFDQLIVRMVQMPEVRLQTETDGDDALHYNMVVSSGETQRGLRISLRLTAPNRQLVWTERADLEDAPSDEDILVQVDSLVTRMLPELEEHIFQRIKGEPTTAYGNFLFSKRHFSTAPSEDYIERVLAYLHRAIEIDPEFLPPYSHLIMNYNTGMFMSRPGTDHSVHRQKAFELSQKLLFLNSKHANGHICMAWCLLWRYKFDAAERSIRRAMDLAPYDPHRLNIIGTALVYLGHHDEAERYYEMAQDRMHHDFDFQRTDYGELYYLNQDYEAALSWMAIPEMRTPYKTYFFRALAHAQLGHKAEAHEDLEAFVEDIRGRWAGPQPFTPEAGLQWYCDLLPLRTHTDRRTLQEGLAKLGFSPTVNGLS